VEWLEANATALGRRAPDLAIRLLRTVVNHPSVDADHRERLATRLTRLMSLLGGPPAAAAPPLPAREDDRWGAGRAPEEGTDPLQRPADTRADSTDRAGRPPQERTDQSRLGVGRGVGAPHVSGHPPGERTHHRQHPAASRAGQPEVAEVAGGALRVELLGPVRAWLGDREIALGSSRPRAVFAMLALRAGAVVRREELIAGVWGGGARATAHGSLHTYVSALRKALGPDRERGRASLLESVRSGYRLRLGPDRSDVAEFDRLREQARQQLEGGDPGGTMRTLDAALELCRGEPLSGLTGPFAPAQRPRLIEGRAAAREQRAEAGLAAGLPAEVVAELAALVGEAPLRERPRELLMLALHRSGRSAEALEAFREARRVLVAELGVEPGPGLRGVHEH